MIVKTETKPYVDAFRTRARSGEPAWLAAKREAALANFGEKGFPTRRQEAWRFTNLRPLERATFPPVDGSAAQAPVDKYRVAGATHRFVFVNGRFAPALSDIGTLPKGAWLASTERTLAERPDALAAAIEETDTAGAQPFASLNAALFADGVVLMLDPGVGLEHPVEIVHWGEASAPASWHQRNLMVLGEGSRARILESFAGSGSYWANLVTTVHLGKGAVLEHAKLQDEAPDALHFAMTRAHLGARARYDTFVLTLGARLAREDIQPKLEGEGAAVGVNGAYLLRGEQEATTAIVVDHAAPGGTTRELWKGVVEERAHGVFLGTIAVRPDAQKTDAQQTNKNLLLSQRANVDTKPELEILADDVKCAHGATVGDLDESALFYLRTRGIPAAEARRMLVEAFAMDAVETVANAAMREYVATHLRRWLNEGATR
ncbi:MAG TPA: Fe-S cluster assembly protein SufD [Casimicrobiaceae bacterium]|nr:Fe-S cluster assembly protein SufD [Casimicrobiaceae bacterium]